MSKVLEYLFCKYVLHCSTSYYDALNLYSTETTVIECAVRPVAALNRTHLHSYRLADVADISLLALNMCGFVNRVSMLAWRSICYLELCVRRGLSKSARTAALSLVVRERLGLTLIRMMRFRVMRACSSQAGSTVSITATQELIPMLLLHRVCLRLATLNCSSRALAIPETEWPGNHTHEQYLKL